MNNESQFGYTTYLDIRHFDDQDEKWDIFLIWGYRISAETPIFRSEIIEADRVYPDNAEFWEQFYCDKLAEVARVCLEKANDSGNQLGDITFYMSDGFYTDSPDKAFCSILSKKLHIARNRGLFDNPNGNQGLADVLSQVNTFQFRHSYSPAKSLRYHMLSKEREFVRFMSRNNLSSLKDYYDLKKELQRQYEEIENINF
ncbi:hypothetical protein AY600_14385 [Phormidium willei BDU 130791]|nr:hypothetical protein AY600_14385 [Phormidium willei BDU 130791]